MTSSNFVIHQFLDDIIAQWNAKSSEYFECDHVSREILSASKKLGIEDESVINGIHSEYWAFTYRPSRDGDISSIWGTHFNPIFIESDAAGKQYGRPDLSATPSEFLDHWDQRAKQCSHPVLAARYNDLLWDFASNLGGRRPNIEHAKRAVDSYLSLVDLSTVALMESDNESEPPEPDPRPVGCMTAIRRACWLGVKIGDQGRSNAAFEKCIEYVVRSYDIHLVGTYAYLYDTCLSSSMIKKCPVPVRDRALGFLSSIVGDMFANAAEWVKHPYRVLQIQSKLVDYHRRLGNREEVIRLQKAMGALFEDHAELGPSALHALSFLEKAEEIYLQDGLTEDALRVRTRVESVAPSVRDEMVPTYAEISISDQEVKSYTDSLDAETPERSLYNFVVAHLVGKNDVERHAARIKQSAPIFSVMGKSIVGDRGTIAKIAGQGSGIDYVYEAAQIVSFDTFWMGRGVDYLVSRGIGEREIASFCHQSPVFAKDRYEFIGNGLAAFFGGQWSTSVHLLLPQIEYAVVCLLHEAGRPTTRIDRGGRAHAVQRGLGDALADSAMLDVLGERVVLHMTATLAHPKGMNLRNRICHGLVSYGDVDRTVAIVVLHNLLILGLPGLHAKMGN